MDEVLDKTDFQNSMDYDFRESLGVSELKKRIDSMNQDSENKKNVINLGSVNLYESKTKETSLMS